MKLKKKLLMVLIVIASFILGCVCGGLTRYLMNAAKSEEETTTVEMYVIASQLNGRAYPTKKSRVECRFDYGDIVTCTGNWSDDHKWIEVIGGEAGTCWCSIDYLTERLRPFVVENEHRTKIKIRSKPEGTVRSYLGAGRTLKITQVVLGWGRCSRGWIDLGYLVEIEDE